MPNAGTDLLADLLADLVRIDSVNPALDPAHAGEGALEKFWSDGRFQQTIQERGDTLRTRLAQIAEHVPGARLKGRGMFLGIDVGSGSLADDICAQCFQDGLIIETSGSRDQVVKVLAPLTIDATTFAHGLDILEQAVHTVSANSAVSVA